MRRFLAYCPEDEPRIFRMLDLILGELRVMVLFIFFLSLLLRLGFAWDGDEKGWVRVSLPVLRMMTGPVQHFRSAFFGGLALSCFLLSSLSGRVFGALNLLIFDALYNYLPVPTCGNEIKCC